MAAAAASSGRVAEDVGFKAAGGRRVPHRTGEALKARPAKRPAEGAVAQAAEKIKE